MYFQLPNGKVVQLSIEEILDLDSNDIQYLLSLDSGEYINNPWSGSSFQENGHEIEDTEDEFFYEDEETYDEIDYDIEDEA